MYETVETLNYLIALGGIALLFGVAILVFDCCTSRTLAPLVRKHTLWAACFLTATTSVMTLVYSEVFDFVPCGLCWLQRVFLYPQVLILATALYLNDVRAVVYGVVLSVPLVIVGLYQHYLQMGGAEVVACPTSGGNCAERTLFEFGFMTFPLISAIVGVFLITLYVYRYKVAG